MAGKFGASSEEIAYIGDDLNDLECIRYCVVSACPSDAIPEMAKEVDNI